MTARLIPLGNRVILRRIEESRRGTGPVVPKMAGEFGGDERELTQAYEIVAVPCSSDFDDDYGNCDVHSKVSGLDDATIGDRVYLARHKGYRISTFDGEELYAADISDILAVEVKEALESGK